VRAEGILDFRGTLGISKEVPVGFQHIQLSFDVDTDASDEQLATLIRLTERYCVVYQTLQHAPDVQLILHRDTTTTS
ncbi:MAG: OsmC family protein, partial [Nitrososphaerota archaeon]